MTSLRELGTFQFENLIRNRIPFTLLNLGADLQGLFPAFYQSHLERHLMPSTAAGAAADIAAAKLPKDHALVVICADGTDSAAVSGDLENAGYHNVYFVGGGTAQVRRDLKA